MASNKPISRDQNLALVQLLEAHPAFENDEGTVIQNDRQIGTNPIGGFVVAVQNSARLPGPDRPAC